MDQIKIGKFIAHLRKEKNMTQMDLAAKLGITDRAVSKWENGRGLPDLSLIKPLCEVLSISINELLNGERINNENIPEKAETALISTLNYSEKTIKHHRTIFLSILAAILLLLATITTCFIIDIGRMRENRPIVFSTWGTSYINPVDLRDEEIELAIKYHLISEGDSEPKYNGEKTFIAMETYLIDEIKEDLFYVYAWVLGEKYYIEDGAILCDSAYSIPHRFEVKEENGSYRIVNVAIPGDGSNYPKDIRELFPRAVRKKVNNFHNSSSYEKLELEIQEQVELYFHEERR